MATALFGRASLIPLARNLYTGHSSSLSGDSRRYQSRGAPFYLWPFAVVRKVSLSNHDLDPGVLECGTQFSRRFGVGDQEFY